MKKILVLSILILITVFFIGKYLLNNLPIFRINKFVIEGNISVDSKSLIDSLMIFKNRRIDKVSNSDIIKVCNNFSRIKSVRIGRSLFGKITLKIEEEKDYFYIKGKNDNLIPFTKDRKKLKFDFLKSLPIFDFPYEYFSMTDSSAADSLIKKVFFIYGEIFSVNPKLGERISEFYIKKDKIFLVISTQTKGNYRVIWGDEKIEKMVNRIIFIEKNFRLDNKILDLRYSNQIIYKDGKI